jgi:NADH:ubiquinone oxidoreductase subunit F (NADH-binding)
MDSIEGLRGEARVRPPFPSTRGLWESPTVINNVETLMNVPQIILKGASWFSGIGTEHSKGTKVFSISGDVERPGVYELIMGSKLRELVIDCAGAEKVRMVQVGGASGRIIPCGMIDAPLSYESYLGSGGVTVCNETRDIIDIVYLNAEFFAEESCGKCTPCREGTEVMVEILGRLKRGDGTEQDIEILEDLSEVMMLSSLCGLGQAAPVSVLDSLRYFRKDYEDQIRQSVFLRSLKNVRSLP